MLTTTAAAAAAATTTIIPTSTITSTNTALFSTKITTTLPTPTTFPLMPNAAAAAAVISSPPLKNGFALAFTKIATWLSTHKWQAILGAVLVTPAVAILQAGFFLAQFRMNFRDAPAPIVPVHGVVVVDSGDVDGSLWEEEEEGMISSTKAGGAASSRRRRRRRKLEPIGQKGRPGGYQRRDTYALHRIKAAATSLDNNNPSSSSSFDTQQQQQQQQQQQPPLKLLVIGDSVAAGVGVSESCTPVFPEVLAKSLSRALGGRAVYWTCVGEAGASAAWVLRQLEAQQSTNNVTCATNAAAAAAAAADMMMQKEEEEGCGTAGLTKNNGQSKSYSSSLFEEKQQQQQHHHQQQETSNNNNNNNDDEYPNYFTNEQDLTDYKQWCQRLDAHQNTFTPQNYGQYDIAVVITGPNELKNGVLPFMVNTQDIELYQHAKQKREERNLRLLGRSVHQKNNNNNNLNDDDTSGGDLRLVIDALVYKMKLRFKESVDKMRTSMEVRIDNVKEGMDRMRTSYVEPVFDNVKDSMDRMRTSVGGNIRRVRENSSTTTTTASSLSNGKRSSFEVDVMESMKEDTSTSTTATTTKAPSAATTTTTTTATKMEPTEETSLLSQYNASYSRSSSSSDNDDIECSSTSTSSATTTTTTATPPPQEEEEKQSSLSPPQHISSSSNSVSEISQQQQQQQPPPNPLIILPGLPIRMLPMFRWIPLRWLAYICINIMENVKRRLSHVFPGTVIFAETPSYQDIISYGNKKGKLWEMRESTEQNVLLSLKSVPLDVCEKKEGEMKEFMDRMNVKPLQKMNHCCRKRRKDNIHEMVSSDMVHPSDFGYDFFGRHVAAVILEEWNKDNNN